MKSAPVSRDILETFPNPKPDRDYVIEHTAPEFTSVCPRTGQPDFATIVLTYVPDQLCLELKSLKLYYQSFRNMGIFYEDVINRMLDDFVAVVQPRWMEVRGEFNTRGGISSVVTAEYRADEEDDE
ncbi:MAG: NADPH-dependent 7-cyano-7-deazaguanine reductase QueF [Armatimonadetes bacterium]|nr:MAG: NADPH-dependent 7-cyano-7-deazaguanine reductase QueF [Armatimonadota bacterium]